MMLHMNLDTCTGCGACVVACPTGAICLVAGKAVVNTELCTVCEACVEVCPTGAITVVGLPAQTAPAAARPSQKTRTAPGGLALWTGIALALVEHQVVPRLADTLVAALERWQARSKPTQATTAWQDVIQGKVGRGPAYRHRRRGNHTTS
jgi:NAD-dependent dihydropyrimidine dehydrogenase PreA subunit